MKLWLDDLRPAPEGWTWIKDSWNAIGILAKNKFMGYEDIEDVTEISFDHDLGEERDNNGYSVAKFIEDWAQKNFLKRIKWTVHSMNPVGRANIEAAMKNADKAWDQFEKHPRPKTYRKSNGQVWHNGSQLTLHRGYWWWDVGCPCLVEVDEKNLPLYDGPD